MSVAAENGRDEALGVGLFGGGSVGDLQGGAADLHEQVAGRVRVEPAAG